MNAPRAILAAVALPFVLTLLFALMLGYRTHLPPWVPGIIPVLLYFLGLASLLISRHFNRSRLIFIAAPPVMLYALFTLTAQPPATLIALLGVLLPLHMLLFMLLRERGFISLHGALKLLFFAAEIALLTAYAYRPLPQISAFLQTNLFAQGLTQWTPLGDIALVSALFVLLILAAMLLFHRLIIYHGATLFMVLLALAGVHYSHDPFAMGLAFLFLLLTALGVVLQDSYRLAFFDELTGLPGRRALMEEMAKLGRKYSLAMVDIDHFKKFNDTYGHDTGDEALKMVASHLARVGGGGKAYRYGGEEFTLLFASKSLSDAFVHADALCQKIAHSGFVVRNKKSPKTIQITISAGIVEKRSGDKDPMAVMKRADNALYKAKKAGRNRVVKA